MLLLSLHLSRLDAHCGGVKCLHVRSFDCVTIQAESALSFVRLVCLVNSFHNLIRLFFTSQYFIILSRLLLIAIVLQEWNWFRWTNRRFHRPRDLGWLPSVQTALPLVHTSGDHEHFRIRFRHDAFGVYVFPHSKELEDVRALADFPGRSPSVCACCDHIRVDMVDTVWLSNISKVPKGDHYRLLTLKLHKILALIDELFFLGE